MDVTAPRPPDNREPVLRPERASPAGAVPPPPRNERPDPAADAVEAFRPPSSLKFTLTAADVDARFEIHEATSMMTVTMYERASGEVLREFPSREVLDVLASLGATGLRVDEVR
ncbi:MAG: flagellar protein FlaG [Thermoleophilia bacterium]